jgi:cytoskeleton protein RodZ
MARKNTDKIEEKQTSVQANVSENLASVDGTDQAEYLVYSRSRCGGALRIAREKQGLSLNDVTSRLKISNKQLEAIESDNFAALPEATIVKGFIRNYAKLLKLDAEPLLDAYNVLVPSKEPLAFTIKPSSTMKVGGYKKPKT